MKDLIKHSLEKAYTYREYNELIEKLAREGRTTGEPDKDRINYTKLNNSRIARLNKTIKLSQEQEAIFKGLELKQTWLVLLESWCADGAQTIPVLNKIAEASENISLKIILRDEHPELMDHFLTNGSRSIPKQIILDKDLNVIASWGPRSQPATKMVKDYKQEFGKIDDAFKAKLQLWYNKDKGKSIIHELAILVHGLEKSINLSV